uniref:Uncharacterized protein n=1 Tax=Choristoneura fumiferana nuclear polyhedrosis virus TaxID=208973 RepID=Q6LCC3_NPVCF|nr:unknown [Choristoneura fumiferana multiple nucleopolyhedrovirus]
MARTRKFACRPCRTFRDSPTLSGLNASTWCAAATTPIRTRSAIPYLTSHTCCLTTRPTTSTRSSTKTTTRATKKWKARALTSGPKTNHSWATALQRACSGCAAAPTCRKTAASSTSCPVC